MAAEAFIPTGTVAVAASTSSVVAALPGQGDTLLIYNTTSGVAFVVAGPTATTAGYVVPPGARGLMKCGLVATQVAVILSTGSGTVYVTQGTGANY